MFSWPARQTPSNLETVHAICMINSLEIQHVCPLRMASLIPKGRYLLHPRVTGNNCSLAGGPFGNESRDRRIQAADENFANAGSLTGANRHSTNKYVLCS